jgi:hypothetical protein
MSGLIPDSLYTWTFLADSGDRYAGVLYDDTGAYVPGLILDGDFGYYVIGAEQAYGYDLGPVLGIGEGTTYTTAYFDAAQGPLQTYNYTHLAAPSSYLGLGYEYDYAWNGAFWDDFGFAGYSQAGYFG